MRHKVMFLFRVHILMLLCCALLACTPQPEVQIPQPIGKIQEAHSLYVVSHGWHTGLILPLNCLQSRLPDLAKGFEQRRYSAGEHEWVEVGWGDKGFYQAQEVTVGLALRAFFASSGSVLHLVRPESTSLDGSGQSPMDYYATSEVLELSISQQELDSVCRFVALSFQRAPYHKAPIAGEIQQEQEGALLPLGKGLYGDSRFYEAKGRYHALHTCNTWTAKGLASAGIDIQPQGTLTASGVMRAARNSARVLKPLR